MSVELSIESIEITTESIETSVETIESDVDSIKSDVRNLEISTGNLETLSEKEYEEIVEISRNTDKLYAINKDLNIIKIELFAVILILLGFLFLKCFKK